MLAEIQRSQLKRPLVITEREGAFLGHVRNLYFNPSSLELTALSFKAKGRLEEYYTECSNFSRVGRDVFFVASLKAINFDLINLATAGKRMKDLIGIPARNENFNSFGIIKDVVVDESQWVITGFILDSQKYLPVNPESTAFRSGACVVPHTEVSQLNMIGLEQGFMRWIFGKSSVDKVTRSLRKALDQWHRFDYEG